MIYENWVLVELHVACQPAKPRQAVQTMPNKSDGAGMLSLDWNDQKGKGRILELQKAKRGHLLMTTLLGIWDCVMTATLFWRSTEKNSCQ